MSTQPINVNLGGDRLGSGAKMNVNLHGYNRSTHDLSYAWRSSMNVGTLVPFMHLIKLPGDTFSIDLESIVRTIPAIGPMYGSYKMQVDVFECPLRLYNGLLHNNMTKIGLNMSQVKFPTMDISTRQYSPIKYKYDVNNSQIASDSLLNYLGLHGVGVADYVTYFYELGENYVDLEREFNATSVLAYYDIYKNYYANKQEEFGYFIEPTPTAENTNIHTITRVIHSPIDLGGLLEEVRYDYNYADADSNWSLTAATEWEVDGWEAPEGTNTVQAFFDSTTSNTNIAQGNWEMNTPELFDIHSMYFVVMKSTYENVSIDDMFPNWQYDENDHTRIILGQVANNYLYTELNPYEWRGICYNNTSIYESNIKISGFPLSNIDQMRIDILKATGLNEKVSLNDIDYKPYSTIVAKDSNNMNYNRYHQCGLALKTYQSDLFNNWLQTEWIDGENGINQITAIDVSAGSFTIDALNLANKVYNMLNRIAVSGGSYEDYIEAVYTVKTLRRPESPVYKGGMSCEIVFEEVVSQSASADEPLGTLAGKGTATNKRGGSIEIKDDYNEPALIIGIVSITPRVDYSQGNSWEMTEVFSMDDLHKPQLDGIGFEDLLQERMAFFGTTYEDGEWIKAAAGKVPAWINYMTAVNETHGTFAEENKCMYMTLNRRYEPNFTPRPGMGIKDCTTYINPTKFNYSFADSDLTAQNFWVQLGCKVIARRVMSAKVIPSL